MVRQQFRAGPAGNKIVNCKCCGKRTHSSIDGNIDIQLCKKCYDEAGLENEHSDGHHEGNMNQACIACQEKNNAKKT